LLLFFLNFSKIGSSSQSHIFVTSICWHCQNNFKRRRRR